MKTVKVYKEELLKVIIDNRKEHVEEYEKMMITFKEELLKGLEHLIRETKEKTKNFRTSIPGAEPRDRSEDYDKIISMLGMSVDEEIELDNQEYTRYVMNQWDWTHSHEFSKSAYLK